MSLRLAALVVPLAVLSACTKPADKAPDTTAVVPASSNAVDVARALGDAWNKRDTAAIDTLMAQDGVHEDVPQAMSETGPAGDVKLMRYFLQSQPDFVWTITDAFENNGKVALTWTWKATYTGPDMTGKMVSKLPVSGRGVSIAEVENGKVKHWTDYYDNASFFPKPKTDSTRKP